jgi:hypothetical protein
MSAESRPASPPENDTEAKGANKKFFSLKSLKKLVGVVKDDTSTQQGNNTQLDYDALLRARHLSSIRSTFSSPSYSSSAASFISQHSGSAYVSPGQGGSSYNNYRTIDNHNNDDISSIADTDFGSNASSTFTEGGFGEGLEDQPKSIPELGPGKKRSVKKKKSPSEGEKKKKRNGEEKRREGNASDAKRMAKPFDRAESKSKSRLIQSPSNYTVDISCVRGFIGGRDGGLTNDESEEMTPLLSVENPGLSKGKKGKGKQMKSPPSPQHTPFFWFHAWNPIDIIIALCIRPSTSYGSPSYSPTSSSTALAAEYYNSLTDIHLGNDIPSNEQCADGLLAIATLWSLCFTTFNTLSLYETGPQKWLAGVGWKGILNDTNLDRVTSILHVTLGYFVSRSVASSWSRWKKIRESLFLLRRSSSSASDTRGKFSSSPGTLGYVEKKKMSTLHWFMKVFVFFCPLFWLTFGIAVLAGKLSAVDSVLHKELYSNCVEEWWATLLLFKNVILA